MGWQIPPKKLCLAAIGKDENQQNVDAFTMANVQNYIVRSTNGKHSWKTVRLGRQDEVFS